MPVMLSVGSNATDPKLDAVRAVSDSTKEAASILMSMSTPFRRAFSFVFGRGGPDKPTQPLSPAPSSSSFASTSSTPSSASTHSTQSLPSSSPSSSSTPSPSPSHPLTLTLSDGSGSSPSSSLSSSSASASASASYSPISSSSSSSAPDPSPALPAKRKPGRPRKHPLPATNTSADATTNPHNDITSESKQKGGHIDVKHLTITGGPDPLPVAPQTQPPKRGRGRPKGSGTKRKSVDVVEAEGTEEETVGESKDADGDEPMLQQGDDEREEFEVEDIVEMRNRRGRTEYRVRWRGWGPEHDTWEPRDHLVPGASKVLEAFEKSLGIAIKRSKR